MVHLKQFCAAAAFKLIEHEKLSLVDQIGSIMDSIPEGLRKATVQQLLNHTSGTRDCISDFADGRMLMGWAFEQVRDSNARLNFPSGEDWWHSNSGHWILSKLVEVVSGLDYQDYLSSVFFEPLGLMDT